MRDFLAWPADEQKQAFEQAGARLGWAPYSVEKDYWVTLILAELFKDDSLGKKGAK
jgi:hypothetical protein